MVGLGLMDLVHPHLWQGSEAEGTVQMASVITCTIAFFCKVRACSGDQTGEGCPGKGRQAEECKLANCPGRQLHFFGMALEQ